METKSSRQLTCVVAVLLVVAFVPSARGKCRSDDDCVLQCPTATDKGVCRRQICSCLPSPALSAANDLRGHPCSGDQDCVKFCGYFKCPVAKCEKGRCSCTCPR